MGKFKMPTGSEFLNMKRIYGSKKDPIWVTLEKYMQENIANKPYNEKVGAWLRFLKDLKYYFFCEARRKVRRLKKEVGPSWYVELSSPQREVLANLKSVIHQDLLEDVTRRVRKSLSDLGITIKFPRQMLIKAMADSVEDPGVFMWNLYRAVYKKSPSELQGKYDMNAMILLSSLVFIDLEECKERLVKLTYHKITPPVINEIKHKKYFQPNVRYGEYLQRMYVPLQTNVKPKPVLTPPPLGYKFHLKSEESLEKLIKDERFLEKRKERNKREIQGERKCNYKFWEPPSTLRNTDPKMVTYVNKLRMLRKKAKPKFKTPFKNVSCLISGVSFTGGKPNYIINNFSLLPSGYISINGGIVVSKGVYVSNVHGFWRYPKDEKEKCDITCECLVKWEDAVMQYLKKCQCKCGHHYDYHNEVTKSKKTDKFFYPPNKHGPFWIDKAKIYQLDPIEDIIKEIFKEAMLSAAATPTRSEPSVSANELKEKELLATFLADLSESPLLIPHLPQANLLNNLQEWVRKRVKGKITPQHQKKMILQSQRRWLDLKHMDFKARAFRIPFNEEQLENMNWSHRLLVQRLFLKLMDDFVTRNRLKQLEQTRLWWTTMKFDAYPSKAFLDIFYTYMPSRMKDTFLINPYSSELTPKSGAKTCRLSD